MRHVDCHEHQQIKVRWYQSLLCMQPQVQCMQTALRLLGGQEVLNWPLQGHDPMHSMLAGNQKDSTQ